MISRSKTPVFDVGDDTKKIPPMTVNEDSGSAIEYDGERTRQAPRVLHTEHQRKERKVVHERQNSFDAGVHEDDGEAGLPNLIVSGCREQ